MHSKSNICVPLGCFLLVVVIVGVGIGTSTYFWKDETSIEEHGRFGIVFDAGGSGTRMYIYEYKNNKDYIQTEYMKCEEKGISSYVGTSNELVPLLKQCLDRALNVVPEDVISSTPVFMKATAGMRKLSYQNREEYDKIWDTVNNVLNNGSFPVRFVGIADGNDEAKYSWTSVNKLLGGERTKGLLEMGSTSMQIAFEPNPSNGEPPLPSNFSEEVVLKNKKHLVYVHSYLCLGKTEFVRRYYASLTKKTLGNSTSNSSVVINDPCSYVGDMKNRSKEYLWETPCITGRFAQVNLGGSLSFNQTASYYTFVGTGNFTQCKQRVDEVFTKNCSHSTCGVNNVFQPEAYGEFMTIGGGAYYAAKFLQLPSNFTELEFERKTGQLCRTNLTEVKRRHGYSSFSLEYCLTNTYTNFLLQKVLRLNRTEPGVVEFVDKINGKKVSWTLGSIIDDKSYMSNSLIVTTRMLASTFYYAILGAAILIVVVAILVFVYRHGNKKRISNRTI